MAEIQMTTPAGELTLRRPHTPPSSPLRAWSAADELVLNELGTEGLGRVLIVNDEFGALACGLATAEPTVWTDSALSRSAIHANLAENDLAAPTLVSGDEQPMGPFETVVIRVPKTTALLDYQLGVVAATVAAGARVVGTGMTRHIHTSTVAAFERLIGPTVTSRAVRKARLIHSQPRSVDESSAAEPPELLPTHFTTAGGLRIAELPGTFSDGHIDAGSALLLEHVEQLPTPAAGAVIADLGCGNGVLGASLAVVWPTCEYRLSDVSDLAIAAARHTWRLNDLAASASFTAADGLAGVGDGSLDLVISNPPFHQGHALDVGLTDRLLADVAQALKPGGTAAIVGQRDLNLHTKMRRWFSAVEVVSKHPNYVVLIATR